MGIILVRYQGRSLATHPLGQTPIKIGGAPDCDVRLDERQLAREEIVLVEKDGKAALRRLGQTRVTRNGDVVATAARLYPGDTIEMGDYQILYLDSDSTGVNTPEAPQAAPRAEAGTNDRECGCEMAAGDKPAGEQDEEEEPALEAASPHLVDASQNVAIGEFISADTAEQEVIAGGTASECEALPVPGKLLELLHQRLDFFARLEELDVRRKELLAAGGLAESVERELRRQIREARELPTAQVADKRLRRVQEKIEQRAGALAEGKRDPWPPLQQEALGLAQQQWMIVIEREEMSAAIIEQTLPLAAREPFFALLKTHKVNAGELFGWTIYALALLSVNAQHVEENASIKQQLGQLANKPQGLLGRWRNHVGDHSQEHERLQARSDNCKLLTMRIARELAAIEPHMVNCFWEIYARTAQILVTGDHGLEAAETLLLRAFLRHGLLGIQPWFLPPSSVRALLQNCRDVVREWDYAMESDHVLYADEYIELVARGRISPSIDEDLELNRRNSAEWKADKGWRRLVHNRIMEAALRQVAAGLGERMGKIRSEREEHEQQRAKLIRTAPDYKQRNRELSQRIQHCRVEAARLQRNVSRIEQKYLPALEEITQDTEEKLEETDFQILPSYLAAREAAGIHRIARLCANLHDAFPPFTLRERYHPGSDSINTRQRLQQELRELEKRDPTIFKEPLIPVKKRSHRIYLRFCPVIIITPSCGFIGYAWNPRHGPEIGRLAIPGYLSRPSIRERMLHNLFADFRWDTSRSSAGVDMLTSETLAAEYAKARWEFRRRSREVREKAGIYTEENDRKNWRRHYALYLRSALEGGRLLFFKCHDIYEKVFIRFLDLPEGVERMRR